jgi:lipoate-protein ligase A
VSANDPRIEFRPSSELRRKLEEFRRELSEKGGRRFSMSEVISAVLEEFFSKKRD